MPFTSQNHRLALRAISSREGLVIDVPPSGKLVVCSGDALRCILQLEDPNKIENLRLEFAGYQCAGQDPRITNPLLRAPVTMKGIDKPTTASRSDTQRPNQGCHTQLFRVVRHIGQSEVRSAEHGIQFEFVFPERDNSGERLPPSLQLEGKKMSGTMKGYCRYQIAAHIERKSLGRIKSETVVLPIAYIPFSEDPTPPQIPPLSTLLARTIPDSIPDIPEKWRVETLPDAWRVEAGQDSSFRRRSRGDSAAAEGMIRVQFAVPDLTSWPCGQPMPYQLLITFTSQTPLTLDPTRSELSFRLEQGIQCKDQSTGAMEELKESIEPGVQGKTIGLEVVKQGIWSGTEEDGTGWSKLLAQIGTIRIEGLPAFSSKTLDLSYQLQLELVLPSDSEFSGKRNVFRLSMPKLSSPIYEGLHGSLKQEEQAIERLKISKKTLGMLGDAYWECDEDLGRLRGYSDKTHLPDDLHKKFETPSTWRSALWRTL